MQGQRLMITMRPETVELIDSVRGEVPLATWIAEAARSRADWLVRKREGRLPPQRYMQTQNAENSKQASGEWYDRSDAQ